jgi:glycosyltransferase involved in cell wall biosynthesis
VRIGIDARELQGQPTGVGRYLRNLMASWLRSNDDVLIAYFNGLAPLDPILDHGRVERRPLGSVPIQGLVWQERRLPEAARRDRLDVFFAPAYSCPLSLELPRVTAIHDMSFFSMPDDFSLADAARRRLLVGQSIGASRHIITISDFTRREILGLFPGATGRVSVVPPGADDDIPAAVDRDSARRALSVEGPYLVSVGSILNRRRLPILVRAMGLLRRRHPRILLEVVGENRTQPRLDFPALVSSLDLDAHVRLSGFVSDARLAQRYAAADAAVYLSEYEGFGLPVAEAMARGVPVVTTDRPATGEVFAGTALLADPSDVFAVAEALDRVLTEPGRAADLVARGRALVRGLTWANASAATRDVLAGAAR